MDIYQCTFFPREHFREFISCTGLIYWQETGFIFEPITLFFCNLKSSEDLTVALDFYLQRQSNRYVVKKKNNLKVDSNLCGIPINLDISRQITLPLAQPDYLRFFKYEAFNLEVEKSKNPDMSRLKSRFIHELQPLECPLSFNYAAVFNY